MLSIVLDRCAELLAAEPGAVLAAGRIGARRPASTADIPALALALSVASVRGSGLGRFIRSGDALAEHTGVVSVAPPPGPFSADLRRLRVEPPPLRRSPAATGEALSEADVAVREVGGAAPVAYRLVAAPARADEYTVDLEAGEVIFGAPQRAGASLEVVHWTVSWREAVLGDRYSGMLTLEIWADSAAQAEALARAAQLRLRAATPLQREKGFMQLEPAALEPAEQLLHAPPTGSPFPAWRQRLSYRFVFEHAEGGELSGGPPIRRVDVELKRPPEPFSVPGS